jgi:hypothetical protein
MKWLTHSDIVQIILRNRYNKALKRDAAKDYRPP